MADSSKQEGGDAPAAIEVPNYSFFKPPAQKPSSFTFYTERYYSQFKISNCKGTEGNNARILLHSNKLCMLCLDPSHVIIKNNLEIESLSHSVKGRGGKERDRLTGAAGAPKGKKKKGAMQCEKLMALAIITTKCGQTFKIPACIDGHILEINPFVSVDPQLVVKAPLTEGFIAVINPKVGTSFDDFELVSKGTSGELQGNEE